MHAPRVLFFCSTLQVWRLAAFCIASFHTAYYLLTVALRVACCILLHGAAKAYDCTAKGYDRTAAET